VICITDDCNDCFIFLNFYICNMIKIAKKYGITREEVDAFSVESQQKAVAAMEAGRFDEEIVPVTVKVKKEMVEITKDQGPRPGTTMEGLSEKLGKKNYTKGVKVEVGTEECACDITIVVKYGYRIQEVAQKVQQEIKNAIETMTGLRVVEVNVNVNSIYFEPEKKEEPAPAPAPAPAPEPEPEPEPEPAPAPRVK